MSFYTLSVICLFGLIGVSRAVIPAGYILQVMPWCGADAINDAKIVIITDLNANAVGSCAGRSQNFTTTDGVKFVLDLSYPDQGSQSCIFQKRQDALVYYTKVSVAYGEPGSLVHQHEEEYTVTCTFGPKGSDQSGDLNVVQGLIAPAERVSNMGADSTSTFTLQLIDVLGGSLDGQDVAMGRTVQLQATSDGTGSELGIRPVSCWAIDGGAKYAILRAGCGDGIIFGKGHGFITNGTSTASPYFKAFGINAGVIVKFSCKFVTCDKNCDGSSCQIEEKAATPPPPPAPPAPAP